MSRQSAAFVDRYHNKAAALHGELSSDSEITRAPSYQWCRAQVVFGGEKAWRDWTTFVATCKANALKAGR